MVEKDAHLGRRKRAPRRMLKYGANLFKRDTGKPLDELNYLGAVFEVLKQCSNRYACSREYPRATNACSILLYDRT